MRRSSLTVLLSAAICLVGAQFARAQIPPSDPLRTEFQGEFAGGSNTLRVQGDTIVFVRGASPGWTPGMRVAWNLRLKSIGPINPREPVDASHYLARYAGTCVSPMYGGGYEERSCEVRVQHYARFNSASCRTRQEIADTGGLEGHRCRP